MYLYAPLGGESFASEHPPTAGDFEAIDDGQLEVFCCSDESGIEYVYGVEGQEMTESVSQGVRVKHILTGEDCTVHENDADDYIKEGWEFI